MRWPHAYQMPKWILSAAAMGMLAAPSVSLAQVAISPATGKPTAVRPIVRKPATQPVAPVVPASGEATSPALQPVEGETAVQRELRRLYNESGREAPDAPTPAQMQRINGTQNPNLTPVQAPLPPYGSSPAVPAPNGTAPAASAPVQNAPVRTTSRNPVVAFFQRIVPGSKPSTRTAPPPPVTRPTVPPPALARQTPAAPQTYAPYNGTQPKRLPDQPAPVTPVVTAPKPKASPVLPPPPPVNLAEKLELNQVATASTEAPPVVIPAPTSGPVITGPSAATAVIPVRSRPPVEPEPVFESPVIVGAETPEPSPFEEPIVIESEPDMAVAATEAPAAIEEFPNPFPEEDEEEADEEAMESPFSGLALDEEEPIVAAPLTAEAAPGVGVPAEPAPLTIPEVTATTAPAPTTAAIEPEIAATEIIPAPTASTPAATLPAGEDAEFFPADFPQPTTVAKPVEVAAPVEVATPAEIVKPVEVATPAEVVKPIEVTQPVEVAKPSDEPVLTLPNDPVIATPTKPAPEAPEYAAKMQKVKDRGGMKGLKGFCPVTLRDERELKDAKPEFTSQFRGQKFHFTSAEAKAKFDLAPAGYAPAAYGADVVVLIRDKDVAEGTLDFAAWYKGQLYLFSSEETYAVFTSDPAKFAAPIGIE